MNARQMLRSAAEELRQAGVPDPEYDSGMLLSEVTGRPHLELRAGMGPDPTEEQAARYAQLIARRKAREPLQYLLGSVIFRSREILTGPGALIPRPETAELAEWAGAWIRQKAGAAPKGFRILDLCCGTGCIGISLQTDFPETEVTLTDLSGEALAITRANLRKYGLACRTAQGDLFAPIEGEKFHLIVSNPPYIPTAECGTLQAEVLREPRMALDGGADGLDFYRRIAREAPAYLEKGGAVMMEFGIGEEEAIGRLMTEGGAARTEIRRDAAGICRMILAEYD